MRENPLRILPRGTLPGLPCGLCLDALPKESLLDGVRFPTQPWSSESWWAAPITRQRPVPLKLAVLPDEVRFPSQPQISKFGGSHSSQAGDPSLSSPLPFLVKSACQPGLRVYNLVGPTHHKTAARLIKVHCPPWSRPLRSVVIRWAHQIL